MSKQGLGKAVFRRRVKSGSPKYKWEKKKKKLTDPVVKARKESQSRTSDVRCLTIKSLAEVPLLTTTSS
ncbi:hypothetical protein, partial [Salmonella sp. s58760]|uniref:hypothetical protein n=1 Tax=Salmonella sp. s58760 TaxID=3159708 RepID=UPI00397F3BEA